jgi:hypothetical protein
MAMHVHMVVALESRFLLSLVSWSFSYALGHLKNRDDMCIVATTLCLTMFMPL